MNNQKYLAPIMDGIGVSPYRSIWIKARGWDTLDSKKKKQKVIYDFLHIDMHNKHLVDDINKKYYK